MKKFYKKIEFKNLLSTKKLPLHINQMRNFFVLINQNALKVFLYVIQVFSTTKNYFKDLFIPVNDRYYIVDNELYCKQFPKSWAVSHLSGTGPKDCLNCKSFGSWNGVFIGYCVNCALDEYEGQRGRGMTGMFGRDMEYSNDEVHCFPSAFDTYLKDIKLHEIGDKSIVDSYKEEIEGSQRYLDELYERVKNSEDKEKCFEVMSKNDKELWNVYLKKFYLHEIGEKNIEDSLKE